MTDFRKKKVYIQWFFCPLNVVFSLLTTNKPVDTVVWSSVFQTHRTSAGRESWSAGSKFYSERSRDWINNRLIFDLTPFPVLKLVWPRRGFLQRWALHSNSCCLESTNRRIAWVGQRWRWSLQDLFQGMYPISNTWSKTVIIIMINAAAPLILKPVLLFQSSVWCQTLLLWE